MMKKAKFMPYLGEVAPTILKRSHYFMKLETIVEEEMQDCNSLCKGALVSFWLALHFDVQRSSLI